MDVRLSLLSREGLDRALINLRCFLLSHTAYCPRTNLARTHRTHLLNRVHRALTDHTKFVGKSVGHAHDVKFSEDGEKVLEGEDIDVD